MTLRTTQGKPILAATLALSAGLSILSLSAYAGPPFGGPEDTTYAAQLWQALETAHLVGSNTIISYPYKGKPPHGNFLEMMSSKVTVQGHNGAVVVKKNFRGNKIDDEDILADHDKYLKSITVMFKREAGYDTKDQDWFWVKYAPNGSLLTNPKGMKLAGRVAKGKSKGCIACHSVAPGHDFLYNPVTLK